MITIRELTELCMPQSARVVAGERGLDAEVTWATRPAPNPPAFGHLRGGELLFLTPRNLQNVDERLTLDASIRQLAGFGIAGIAFAGRIAPNAKVAAETTGIPLVQLPVDFDLAQLEREAGHLINERRRESQRRTQESSRRFMEMAIGGESLSSLAEAIALQSHSDVLMEARDGRVIARHLWLSDNPESIAREVQESRAESLAWLRTTATGSPAEPPAVAFPLRDGRQRYVAPIMGRDGLLGLLSLVDHPQHASNDLTTLVSRAAAACAVMLSREHAAAQARQELELNVLDEILDGALRSEVSLIQQAKRLGFELSGSFVAMNARIDTPAAHSQRSWEGRMSAIEEILNSRRPEVMWRLRYNQAELICAVPDNQRAEAQVRRIYEDLAAEFGKGAGVLSMGVGRLHQGIPGIRQSHQESRQALQMGRRLNGPGSYTHFDDLGVFRLIFAAQELPELRTFHDEALGHIIDYDLDHNAELLRTLQAYFAARCGPKEAAASLGVHRNTVLYRLERIQEMTGLDLNDADVRLRLHLAVNTHVALFGQQESVATLQPS